MRRAKVEAGRIEPQGRMTRTVGGQASAGDHGKPLPRLTVVAILVVLAAACDVTAPPEALPRGTADRPRLRDVDELQRIKRVPTHCEDDTQCPTGSYCDDSAGNGECRWECLADSDCGETMACNAQGGCQRALTTQLSADSPACLAIPFDERRAALLALNAEERVCVDDNDCPCGSYCAGDASCQVECMSEEPANSVLFCGSGQSCSPLGRCSESPTEPGPAIELVLELAPVLLAANTSSGPVVVQAEITAVATSLDVLDTAHPARVLVGFAERNDPDPGVMPGVKCAESAPFSSTCELDGGWSFQPASGNLRSQPRKVWIEVPQLTADVEWTLEARSEWADLPASAVVRATPATASSIADGEYTGKLTWPQWDGTELELDVTAIAKGDKVAFFDPTRILLPDGHAVLWQSGFGGTAVGWLRSDAPGTNQYVNLLLQLSNRTYDPTTGRLEIDFLTTHEHSTFLRQFLKLTLDRRGDVSVPLCTASTSCGIGTYCNVDIGLCLPGTGAPAGGVGQIGDSQWTLPSAQVQAWLAPLNTLVAANPQFAGTNLIGMERAYCNWSPTQMGAARFAHNTIEPSRDLACYDGTPDGTPQQVFEFSNRSTEIDVNERGEETFNLLDRCLANLRKQPVGPSSPANLLPVSDCASLGRFFLALRASVTSGVTGPLAAGAKKLLTQIFRQWLSVNAFVARTTLQEQDYDDSLGTEGLPPNERLGAAVDLMEGAWRILLDPAVFNQFKSAIRSVTVPDYRLMNRPVLHWGFNDSLADMADGSSDDSENDFDLVIRGNILDTDEKRVEVTSSSNGATGTTRPVALDDRHFSLVGFVGAVVEGKFTLFEKVAPNGHRFWVTLEWHRSVDPAHVVVEFQSTGGGLATFKVDAMWGYYAFVVEGQKYRLYRVQFFPGDAEQQLPEVVLDEFSPISISGGGPIWGPAGGVGLAGDLPKNEALESVMIFDEVSLWSRSLSPDAILAMGKPYFDEMGIPMHATVTVPDSQIVTTAGDEQSVGLSVHILEAANAHAELLAGYIEAERALMYEECYLGGPSPARERLLGRVGRSLRLIYMMEYDAGQPTDGVPMSQQAWFARYQANQTELAGRRAKIFEALRSIDLCQNPLGIADDDLPLYHGNAVGSSDKFFASSRFLAANARTEIDAAENKLAAARNAYAQLRQSAFDAVDKTERVRRLKLEYESILRRHCGVPTGGESLLTAFREGRLTIANCFFKREQPSCQNVTSMTVASAPATCLRGELGEQVLAIQAAAIGFENSKRDHDRAIDRHNAAVDYCSRRKALHDQAQRALAAHQQHMKSLRKKRRFLGLIDDYIKNGAAASVGAITRNPAAIGNAWEISDAGMALNILDVKLAASEEEENDRWASVVQALGAELDGLQCRQDAENQKFAIDATSDVMRQMGHDYTAALFRLEKSRNELTALIVEAEGEIRTQEQIERAPPHHHFWMEDNIEEYGKHLRNARRLTYLTLRSFEYESQQSIGRRGKVLTARDPGDLREVVTEIEQRNAPMQGENGFVVGETSVVFSLRDEILRLGDLVNDNPPPGYPSVTPEEAFRILVRSESAAIHDANGLYLGQGIRFEMRPGAWSETSCAERIWRVTMSLQMAGTLPNARIVLAEENAFGSQQCNVSDRGTLHMARIRPHHNLMLGDSPANFVRPSQYTEMNVNAHINRSREDMEVLIEGEHGGFAGRGLYGKYLLLFPAQTFPDAVLAGLNDVLVRFDIVEVTNVEL